MSNKGTILIRFAWAMEIVGVAGGVINSTYTTFGDNLPSTPVGYLPAVPMVALAVAELGRVPLASVLFHKHKLMQGIAILGLMSLGYLAVENWTFGFERIVDLRLKTVNSANRGLSRAEADLAALLKRREQVVKINGAKREELRRGVDQRDSSISELTNQLGKEAEVHQGNLERIREACRIIKEYCMVPRSKAEDTRYADQVSRLDAELAAQRSDRKQLQSQIDELVSTDTHEVADIDRKISTARDSVTDAWKARSEVLEGNQIYRLAASFYGVNTSDVTAEQFATARWVFSTFSALAVALAGSIAALIYYSGSRVPGTPSLLSGLLAKLARARRAYYARRRRPLKIEVPGPERVIYRDGKERPTVVEKEVVRFIDQIVLIPRWGISAPFHVNSLFRRTDQGSSNSSSEVPSNVMPLKKVN
jgi:hypothetical protein